MPVKEMPPIPAELISLSNNVEEFTKALITLRERLNPVLQPVPPTPAMAEVAAQRNHGILGDIERINSIVSENTRTVSAMLGSLQL